MAKRYICRLSDNEWSNVIANVLNKYEQGQSITPNVNLNKSVTLPTVNVQMTPETKTFVKIIGFTLAAAIAFEGYTQLKKHR